MGFFRREKEPTKKADKLISSTIGYDVLINPSEALTLTRMEGVCKRLKRAIAMRSNDAKRERLKNRLIAIEALLLAHQKLKDLSNKETK